MRPFEVRRAERIVNGVERWFVGGMVAFAAYMGFCALGVALAIAARPSLGFLTVAAWLIAAVSLAIAVVVAKGLDARSDSQKYRATIDNSRRRRGRSRPMAEDRTPRQTWSGRPTVDLDDVALRREHDRRDRKERALHRRDPDHSVVADLAERLGEDSGHTTPGSRVV